MKITNEDRELIKRDLETVEARLLDPVKATVIGKEWVNPIIQLGYTLGKDISALNYYSNLATGLQALLLADGVSGHLQKHLEHSCPPDYVIKYFQSPITDRTVGPQIEPVSSVYDNLQPVGSVSAQLPPVGSVPDTNSNAPDSMPESLLDMLGGRYEPVTKGKK